MILDAYVVDLENFHHVQREILNRLYLADEVAYSDLKPPELTGNSFNYHLRHVAAQKLIEKTAVQRYRLTPLGRLLVDNVSRPAMKLKLRPAVGVTLLVRSKEHGILLYSSQRAAGVAVWEIAAGRYAGGHLGTHSGQAWLGG